MKLALLSLVASVGLAAAAVSSDTSGSPVERIVNLLKELKEKTANDGKSEQQIYDKYASNLWAIMRFSFAGPFHWAFPLPPGR